MVSDPQDFSSLLSSSQNDVRVFFDIFTILLFGDIGNAWQFSAARPRNTLGWAAIADMSASLSIHR